MRIMSPVGFGVAPFEDGAGARARNALNLLKAIVQFKMDR
jgi:hypothetical protein